MFGERADFFCSVHDVGKSFLSVLNSQKFRDESGLPIGWGHCVDFVEVGGKGKSVAWSGRALKIRG